jgi:type VI secretion system protein ImpL
MVWLILGLLLLSAVIWFGGPYLALGEFRPLESTIGRIIAIALIVVLWGFKGLLRELKALRASTKFAAQVVKQEDPVSARASADTRQMRQRFEEAIEALRKSKTRKGRINLYELPWYIIIGPPGAGKTTAIVNSGLNFPLSQKFGKEALRGVGGTRNCDWWFTDQAILLDTAGRYTTQDSDESTDAAGWVEFLALLRRYRKRRPINGILVAISVLDLATQSDVDRARHVAAVRQRLDELRQHLKITVPVYLIVTKCDLLAGFSEFFDDLSQDGRAQVWGTTFDIELSRSGEAVDRFASEFDLLVERLNTRLLARMEAERDVNRRGLIFGFPRQFAGVRRPVTEFVSEVFGSSSFSERALLRGVYFTSGTQEGTPIDRMLGALARTFGLGVKALHSQTVRGRAYFIQQLLTHVLFKESGLAGVSRRMEVREALLQTGTYIGIGAITLLGILALSVSYGRNRAFLNSVETAIQPLEAFRSAGSGDLIADLPRLDTFREVLASADKHTEDVPLTMRMGLYQGRSVRNAAQDAYARELNDTLAPALAVQLQERMSQLAGEPEKLYEYLKAYLMLGEPQRLDRVQFLPIAQVEWSQRFPGDAATIERLSSHAEALVADQGRVQPVELDREVVERARISLRQASLPMLMYSHLKLLYSDDAENAINLENEIGLRADSVFIRKSGAPLSAPIPALYTRKVFDEIATTGKLEVATEFVGDSWVLGEGIASLGDVPQLSNEMMNIYEDDYIRAWDALLADLQPKSTTGSTQLTDMMALLASSTSPLKRLLVLVEANTNLLKPLKTDEAKSLTTSLAEKAKKEAEKLQKVFKTVQPVEKPGTRVTRHFEPLHKLVDGPPGGAPIDQTLRAIGQIQQQLGAMGGGLGDTGALESVTAKGQADALGQLRIEAMQLPAPISTIVAQVGGKSEALAKGQASRELANRYQAEVAAECSQLIDGRYPFSAASGNDVPLADFGRLFGYGGVFETFFRERLALLVDTSQKPWRWKEGAGAIGGSTGLLAQFQAVDRIRQVYFRPGGQLPEMRFNVVPEYLDASVRRLAIDIDGQIVDYRHGPPRTQSLTWPGPSSGQAGVVFEESGGPGPNRTYQGPWALFRLLEDGSVQPQSDVRYLVTLSAGGRTARVALEAASVRNPFARNELRNFRCAS